jgi:hypothetical protein
MDEYKRRDEHNEDYQVSKGSAAWVAFAGAVSDVVFAIFRLQLKSNAVRHNIHESVCLNEVEKGSEAGRRERASRGEIAKLSCIVS